MTQNFEQIIAQPERKEQKKPNYTLRRIGAVALVTGMLAGGWEAINIADHIKNPFDISSETHSVTIEPGDGLYDAAETIQGIDAIDIRDAVYITENMQANKDVLSDGLQPGEVVQVPNSITKR